MLQEYDAAVDEFRKKENPSTEDRILHIVEWQRRFQKAVSENPGSIYIGAANSHLLGLCNGLGDYEESQKLLQGMISSAVNESEKIYALIELGEVSRARYRASHDRDEAQKSLDAFAEAHRQFLLLPESERSSDLSGYQIIAFCMAGDIARAIKDHAAAAALFQSAREFFQSSPEAAAEAVMVNYDLESITEQEMAEWIHAEDKAKAVACLEVLSELPAYRWAPSYCAHKFAELCYADNSLDFQIFIEKWIEQKAFDKETPILMAELAFSYYDQKFYEKALPLYETLRLKHKEDFQKLEPEAFKQEKGGYYERILYDLAIMYLSQGRVDDAKNIQNELSNVLGKSESAKLLPQNIPEPEVVIVLPKQRIASNLIIRLSLAALGFICLLLAIYIWRRK